MRQTLQTRQASCPTRHVTPPDTIDWFSEGVGRLTTYSLQEAPCACRKTEHIRILDLGFSSRGKVIKKRFGYRLVRNKGWNGKGGGCGVPNEELL
ncbi:hypothetical protein CDAR_539931 [Caerostris darwini]|uniref:Uncharacterized protein n=1 Tax=Caerostris darwini TaxID=1538125 RepID=A0AAV4TI16_9ARAC|nr:hypothetical protein CDAR_539931 [Caerostris darwini]